MIRHFFLVIAFMSLSLQTFAIDISDSDIKFFKEESYSAYDENVKGINSESDLKGITNLSGEDVLYISLKLKKSNKEALKFFSSYFGLDTEMAGYAVDGIINSLKLRMFCDVRDRNKKCESIKPSELSYKVVASSPLTTPVMQSIAENLDDTKYRSLIKTLIGDNENLLLKVFIGNHSFDWLEKTIHAEQTNIDILCEISIAMNFDSFDWDIIAFNQFILDSHPSLDFKYRKRIETRLLSKLFRNGFNEEAFSRYLKIIGGNLSSYLSSNKDNIFNCDSCEEISDLIAAYYISKNDKAAAKEILSVRTQLFRRDPGIEEETEAETKFFLGEYIDRKLSREDAYYYFIDGHAKDARVAESTSPRELSGWLSSVSDSSDLIRNFAIQYLSDQNYPEMVGYIKHQKTYSSGTPFLLAERLGKSFLQLQADYKAKIEAKNLANENWIDLNKKDEPYELISKFEERKLDRKYVGARPIKPASEKIPTPIPVSEYRVKRIEKFSGEWYSVYTSGAVDPTGEISEGGYWLIKTSQQGHVWDKPIYLGLQEFYPYEVLMESALPLISNQGVDLEVELKEIDEASISFPPVGIRFKREAKNLYIHFDWSDLLKDSDQDGLTDILENKIGSNPFDNDTDHDGISDGVDSLPLTKFESNAESYEPLAKLLLSKVLGIEDQAITVGVAKAPDDLIGVAIKTPERPEGLVGTPALIDPQKTIFLSGDSKLFRALNIPFRLIFIEDVKNLKKTGYLLPVDFGWVFSNADKTEFHVIWSAGFTGGAFKIYLKDGKFDVVDLSHWIT